MSYRPESNQAAALRNYSDNAAPNGVGVPEKRTAGNRVAVDIVAHLRQSNTNAFQTQLLDLSPTGFQVESDISLRDDLPLIIRIPGLEPLSAHIRWHRGDRYGCQFRNPLYEAVFDHILRVASA